MARPGRGRRGGWVEQRVSYRARAPVPYERTVCQRCAPARAPTRTRGDAWRERREARWGGGPCVPGVHIHHQCTCVWERQPSPLTLVALRRNKKTRANQGGTKKAEAEHAHGYRQHAGLRQGHTRAQDTGATRAQRGVPRHVGKQDIRGARRPRHRNSTAPPPSRPPGWRRHRRPLWPPRRLPLRPRPRRPPHARRLEDAHSGPERPLHCHRFCRRLCHHHGCRWHRAHRLRPWMQLQRRRACLHTGGGAAVTGRSRGSPVRHLARKYRTRGRPRGG